MDYDQIMDQDERHKVTMALHKWFKSQDITPIQSSVIMTEMVGKIIAFITDLKVNQRRITRSARNKKNQAPARKKAASREAA